MLSLLDQDWLLIFCKEKMNNGINDFFFSASKML